jgi:hypothetical protein
MRMRRRAWNLIPLSLALVAISGCGSSQGIWVTGKLTKGGAKYEVPADQNLHITFYSMDPFKNGERTIPAGEAYMGVFKPDDGTFTVTASDGNGIPPGKYRVSLTQQLTRKAVDKKNEKLKPSQTLFDRDTDMLKGQFGPNSPIVREVKTSEELVIDLDRRTL